MDKLIELLDEYRKQNPREFFGDEGSLVVLTGKDFIELNRLIIISKEYGFIKWLVENNKIVLGDIALKVYNLDLKAGKHIYTEYPIYESLLMLLSISSSPIKDLIDYLR